MRPMYTQDEQDRIDIADTLTAALRRGDATILDSYGRTVFVTEGTVQQARAIAENMRRNAEARALMQAARQAEQDAQRAKQEAVQQARAAEQRTEWQARARFAFLQAGGTTADFERQEPALWAAYLQRTTLEALDNDDAVTRKRELYQGF